MKTKLMLTVFVSMIAIPSWAGQEGHGGYAWVCRDANTKKITSAESLDLYEGRNLHKLTIPKDEDANGTKEELASRALERIGYISNELNHVRARMEFLPEGVFIRKTQDSGHAVEKSGECRAELVAKWSFDAGPGDYNNDVIESQVGKIIVNADIWSELKEQSRAALEVHESVYEYLRRFDNIKTTERVLRIVSVGFSNTPVVKFNEVISTDDILYYCGTDYLEYAPSKFNKFNFQTDRTGYRNMPKVKFAVIPDRTNENFLKLVFFENAGRTNLWPETLKISRTYFEKLSPKIVHPYYDSLLSKNHTSTAYSSGRYLMSWKDVTHNSLELPEAMKISRYVRLQNVFEIYFPRLKKTSLVVCKEKK